MFKEEITKKASGIIEEYFDFLCSNDRFKYNISYLKKKFISFQTKREILENKVIVYDKLKKRISKKKSIYADITITIDLLFEIKISKSGNVETNYIKDSAFWEAVDKNFYLVIKNKKWNAAFKCKRGDKISDDIELMDKKCTQIINLHK